MKESKLQLVDGTGDDPVSMVRQIVRSMEAEGGTIVGLAVFARNDATGELHTCAGGPTWPDDLADWREYLEALRHTIDDALQTKAREGTSSARPLRELN